MDVTSHNLVAAITKAKDAIAAVLAPVVGPLLAGQVGLPTATTTQLTTIGHAINTTNKTANKLVLNTTTNLVVRASGTTAAAHWYSMAGADTHTPA